MSGFLKLREVSETEIYERKMKISDFYFALVSPGEKTNT
jgi:hypothetical protein